jgi:two-component system chemotaxis response regulator CheY
MFQKSILVVDDDRQLLEGIEAALNLENYDVDTAQSGIIALEKLEEKEYDVVILDYRMQPIDGVEVLKRIRQKGYDSSVIMITAYGTFDMATQALQYQATTILPKPFEIDRLLTAVKTTIQGRILRKRKTKEKEEKPLELSDEKDNILVVDDSKLFRKMIVRAISSNFDNFNYIEAENGVEALEKLSKYDVKLIISDINMPNMTGIEFMKLMRKSSDLKKIPIVVLTTEKKQETKNKAYFSGATAYVNKPFKNEELAKVIKTMLYWKNN